MKKQLFRNNPWWDEEAKKDYVERPGVWKKIEKNLPYKDVCILLGLRRVGKTTILKQTINKLIEQGIPANTILFFYGDDYDLQKHTFSEIIDEARKIHRHPFSTKLYVFIDEVTYQPNFELQLKNLYDSQNLKLFISSSSASLLKRGQPHLTGRNHVIDVLPLEFSEYLRFRNIEIKPSDEHLTGEYFKQYLEDGGMPEYVLRRDPAYLQQVADDIIYKDILSKQPTRDIMMLKDYFLLLMERAGKQLSINKIAKVLNISTQTASKYYYLFADNYLIHTVVKWGKTNERIKAVKKIYAPDLGIRNRFTGFRDYGALFENYVFLKIKHRNPCYVKVNGIELDFMLDDKTLVEAKYHPHELLKAQQKLFDNIDAKTKHIVRSYEEVEDLQKKLLKGN
jgi:hypothetical protein